MVSSRYPVIPRLVASALGAASFLSLAGCGSMKESFNFHERHLVKVPDGKILPGDRRSESQGWTFRHIVEAPHDPRFKGNWYVAWQDGPVAQKRRPLLGALIGRWERTRRLAPSLAEAAKEALGVYPSVIEPSFAFASAAKGKAEGNREHPVEDGHGTGRPAVGDLYIRKGQTAAWPKKEDLDWHLQEGYSQLTAAQKRGQGGKGIRIAICDNGITDWHAGAPRNVVHDSHGDAYDYVIGTPREFFADPAKFGGPHGTAASALLAGGPVKVWKDSQSRARGEKPLYEGLLGGAPEATVVPVRIAPWVFSLNTASMAYGLDYASRVQQCDVISLSHGGSPSLAWVDAVNAAYDRGTAIFAAEGDFFSLSFNPFSPDPIIVPSSPVYPAAFRRVVGVTGAAADHESYARNVLSRLLRAPQNLLAWMARGSYGPDGWRTRFKNEAEADPSQHKYGLLHAYPIAGYSPNVPWIIAPEKKNQWRADLVDLDGSGTSASTPQVAAAAALWLNAHRDDKHTDPQGRTHSLRKDWRTWRKAEAVYFALLDSAARSSEKPDRYLGAGELKAADALRRSYHQVSEMRNDLLNFPYRKTGPAHDYFDGSRSFWALLRGQGKVPPVWDRADLHQQSVPLSDRERVYNRLYANLLLLQKWHDGRVPSKKEETSLRKAGAGLARRYVQAYPPVPVTRQAIPSSQPR